MHKKLRTHFESIVPLTDEEYTLVSSYFKIKFFKKHQFMVGKVFSFSETGKAHSLREFKEGDKDFYGKIGI